MTLDCTDGIVQVQVFNLQAFTKVFKKSLNHIAIESFMVLQLRQSKNMKHQNVAFKIKSIYDSY